VGQLIAGLELGEADLQICVVNALRFPCDGSHGVQSAAAQQVTGEPRHEKDRWRNKQESVAEEKKRLICLGQRSAGLNDKYMAIERE
jgi:hypothetical protein